MVGRSKGNNVLRATAGILMVAVVMGVATSAQALGTHPKGTSVDNIVNMASENENFVIPVDDRQLMGKKDKPNKKEDKKEDEKEDEKKDKKKVNNKKVKKKKTSIKTIAPRCVPLDYVSDMASLKDLHSKKGGRKGNGIRRKLLNDGLDLLDEGEETIPKGLSERELQRRRWKRKKKRDRIKNKKKQDTKANPVKNRMPVSQMELRNRLL